MTDCATLVAAGWADHADRPDEVAARLAASLPGIATSDDALAVARLAAHVYGEHLGRWSDGVALIEAIAALPPCAGDATAAGLRRHVAMLRFAGGDRASVDGLERDDCAAALAGAAAALAGRRAYGRAISAFTEALAIADAGLASGSPAVRALAVGGNNLACALEEHGGRDDRETQGMVMAAGAALRFWKQAGTWLEEERAEYRLAMSLLQARRVDEAIAAAQRCVGVCERHDAPPFERFYAWAAIAAARRAAGDPEAAADALRRCREQLDAMPPDERASCDADWRALQ